ncbi:hypothetical protein CEP54_012957 [Fusarium duplospermum]|uniref:Heterokaryon incompatibility domain-containing protein n=1 Tax=Fusarium duplospermum TaxID=1325734 RepID=A0A428P5N8_9HYPO|nr:hypothetical protein CEP54_012957 [Fusarium duplospermum]
MDMMDIDSDESSDEARRICHICSGITAQALTSTEGYHHAATRSDLVNMQPYCDLCNVLLHQIFPSSASLFNEYNIGNFRNLRLRTRRLDTLESNVVILTIDTDSEGTLSAESDILEVWTPLGDRAAVLGLPVLNTHLTNTKSTETFKFIQKCLDECSAHDCKSPLRLETSQSAPSRLLDVDNNTVRLIDVGKDCPPYVALSHCWGTNLSKYMTVWANLTQKKAGISWNDLTPTFRDAIEITRRLKLRYIWIDALCIIQDSKEDWANESVKMGDIYHNAFLTVSASHARDGFGGCFNSQSAVGLGETFITITNRDQLGQESSIIFASTISSDPPRVVENSPINDRGWVYQERILSPRIVHFASTQVVWECRKTYRLENLRPMALPTIPSMILRPDTVDNDIMAERWHRGIVEVYCRRAFTRYDDRLVALAGIAQIYQMHIKDRYLAGLWKSHLAYGLSWGHTQRPNHKPQSRRHPSWTWASQDGEMRWYPISHFAADAGFSLLANNLDFDLTARREFSPVKGGYITVQGRVAQVTRIDPLQVTASGVPLTAFGDVDFYLGNIEGKFFADELPELPHISSKLPEVLALALGHVDDFASQIRPATNAFLSEAKVELDKEVDKVVARVAAEKEAEKAVEKPAEKPAGDEKE